MRVALIDAPAGGLRSRPLATAELVLDRRGFTPGLTAVPRLVADLARVRADLVHAHSVPGALAGLAWGRGPVVFTCHETLGRATVADRRLRLWSLRRALEDTDAVLAADAAVATALERWFAVEAPIAGDHEALYRDLLA